jgi:exopolyphosphatase/guanosine-5'-triphosphate,3'-diphosphate pyrophosphatase
MIVAIMDLGTNTFHLMVASVEKNNLKILYKTKVAVKLGENGITSNLIGDKAFRRGVNAMKRFSKTIEKFHPAKVIAIGTAAIRNAKNKKKFLQSILHETGIEVKVITGLQEASLIYQGVKQAVEMNEQKSLIMDIGGGSIELIIADQKKIYWKHSFKLGAALLLEKFKPSDPLTKKEFRQIIDYLEDELKRLIVAANKFHPQILTGSSGSFETFADMISWQFYKPGILKNKTAYEFNLQDYRSVYNLLLKSTTSERKKMKGLIAMRIDMIVIAAIIVTFVLQKLKINRMILSAYALKEGILWETKNKIIVSKI